jgi:hypothetical protein
VRARLLVLVVAAALLAAGCLTGDTEGTDDAEAIDANADQQATPEDTSSNASKQPDRLDHPPSWIPGEYWTIRVTSTLLDEPVQWTRVVAGYTQDSYLVGQPAANASIPGLLLHVPGLGEVGQANLSYSVHGSTFTPLPFPLEDGKT